MPTDIVSYYFLTNKLEKDFPDKTKVRCMKNWFENDCMKVIMIGSFSK